MKWRVTKANGQKVVIQADSVEVEKDTGRLILWKIHGAALLAGDIVESYQPDEWRGVERWQHRQAIPPCDCGG